METKKQVVKILTEATALLIDAKCSGPVIESRLATIAKALNFDHFTGGKIQEIIKEEYEDQLGLSSGLNDLSALEDDNNLKL